MGLQRNPSRSKDQDRVVIGEERAWNCEKSEIMSSEEQPKLDVSMWPDSRLRPWTIDDALDQAIDEENLSLDDRVLKTSGSKLAGTCSIICLAVVFYFVI